MYEAGTRGVEGTMCLEDVRGWILEAILLHVFSVIFC